MRTIDTRNLPPVTSLSADMTSEELEAARQEALGNADAAMNTVVGGQRLTDLSGSYLARAGAIQIQLLLKKEKSDEEVL